MPFLLMLFLTLACLPENWPEPWRLVGSPVTSVLLTWLGVLLEVGLAFAVSRRVQLQLHDTPAPRDQVLRNYSRGRLYHLIGLFASYALALYFFGYGWAVQELWTRHGRPLPELLLLAPFCVALLLSWTCFYDAERALSGEGREAHDEELAAGHPRKFWSRAAYVGFHFRQNLALVFLPILLLLTEKELRRRFPALNQQWQVQASFVGVGIALVVFMTMPWILRIVLGLQPLPEGPLRDRLLTAARRLRFRCSDILLWNTRGGIANAMVVGVFPFLRYVLLSDRLLEDLTPDEVEAVFGHEVGHVKHHHMLYYLVFLLASIFVLGSLVPQNELDEALNLRERRDLAVLPVVGALGAYIFLVFGFLSRRCERQADIYGCRAVSCQYAGCDGHLDGHPLPDGGGCLCPTGIQTFIQALEKVALLNGMSRDKPGFLQSWQHSTIARRVSFLQSLLTDPRAERRFQRRVFLVKCAFLGVLAVGLVVCSL
ncbi:MAG: M48 family metalloprotease [Planctomycetes bacterium]|nr:M48 family metalloprotease [Planctomycetota bacterium]